MIKLKDILTESTDNLLQTFPIGSKNFNVGYDAEISRDPKQMTRDIGIPNSDYGGGDAAHRSRGGHLGIDIFAPKGEPVVAPVTGTIVSVSKTNKGAGGKSATIENNGLSFYMAHLDQVYVEEGQDIEAGQLIGTCGSTGNAAGTHPHVHFSIYRTKEGYTKGSINPWPSLQNVLYSVTKSDRNLQDLHAKLEKLGFNLGDETENKINGPKTRAALSKLNKKYQQNQQTGGFSDKVAGFISGIVNSDFAQSILGNKIPVNAPEQPKIATSSGDMTNPANRVITFLKNKGLTTSQSSGVAGNLSVESQFQTDVVGDNGTSYGLAQWHNDRWDKLKKYCAKNDLDPASFIGQMEFLWWELKTNSRLGYSELIKQKNPRDAAEVFAKNFERPAHISSKRMDNAEDYYNEYTKNAADKIA
jgi:biotin carboxyl carrier protein